MSVLVSRVWRCRSFMAYPKVPCQVGEKFVGGFTCKYVPISLDPDSESFLDNYRVYLQPLVSSPRASTNDLKLRLKRFKEGMSNVLIGIFEEKNFLKKGSLVRVYGVGSETVSRDDEIVAMRAMQEAGEGAVVHCQFKNGLCYSFLPGRYLTLDEMGEAYFMKRLAVSLAKIHSLDIPEGFKGRLPNVWTKSERWLDLILRKRSDLECSNKFIELFTSVDVVKKEYETLRENLSSFSSPLVLCHNDLSHQNIIYCEETDKVSLIDFEYSGLNYSAFDIADYFTEFAGVDNPDYGRYPCEAVQKTFIRMYLEEYAKLNGMNCVATLAEVHAVYREANKLALCSHMFWTLWSLIQALYSPLHCDYIEYAAVRFAEFQRRKKEFYAL